MDNENNQQNSGQFTQAVDVFRRMSLEYAQDPESLANQMVLVKAFGSLVESAQQVLKPMIEAEGEVAPQLAKEVFFRAQDISIIDDAGIWIEALDYCSKLKKSDKPDEVQEALDFSQTYFTDAVDDLAGKWEM